MTADDARPPIEQSLLDVWEEGGTASATRRAELLLGVLGLLGEEWPDVSVGERNRSILVAHRLLFGAGLDAVIVSPCCSERIELHLPIDAAAADAAPGATEVDVETGVGRVTCRPPTCADLAAVAGLPPDAAGAALVDRCASWTARDDEAATSPRFSTADLDAIGDALARIDPLAVIDVRTTCPQCEGPVTAPLEPTAFTWSRLDAWAARLLEEIDLLAARYGWTEREILSVSPYRRRSYLRIMGAA